MSMKWFKILGIVTGMATQVAGEVVQALADGVLDGPELGNIIKKGIMGLRLAGVSHDELDQIQWSRPGQNMTLLSSRTEMSLSIVRWN
jgi:hypothetical protein